MGRGLRSGEIQQQKLINLPQFRPWLLVGFVYLTTMLGVSGCASVRQILGRELVPVETEVRLGQQLAQQVETENTVLPDAELQRYVRLLAQPLIEQAWADRPDIDYRITVLDDDKQVNAFALPGGPMYVYTGLLVLAADEAELAGVLAHELGHVVARHSANQLATSFGVQLLVSISLGEAPEQLAQIAANLAGAGAMARFSRDDERQADDFGVRYTIAAGYDPRGLITLFDKMARLEAGGGNSLDRLLASHPATDERMARIRRRIEATSATGERRAARYQEMTQSLR
ncbi:MAG: M48 family metallopeptidase [bacterium]|nr:M48 family metallopeptidase [bacterium]